MCFILNSKCRKLQNMSDFTATIRWATQQHVVCISTFSAQQHIHDMPRPIILPSLFLIMLYDDLFGFDITDIAIKSQILTHMNVYNVYYSRMISCQCVNYIRLIVCACNITTCRHWHITSQIVGCDCIHYRRTSILHSHLSQRCTPWRAV